MAERRVETILDAMESPHLFQRWFRDVDTWAAWCAFLAALFALPMDQEAEAVYRACTGRTAPPPVPFTEAWLVVGRRGGKSFILAFIAVFLACFKDWKPYLMPGERGVVIIVARDRSRGMAIWEMPAAARILFTSRRDGREAAPERDSAWANAS
jgi:hypothetical protein